jgi:hypothetical protein
MTWVLSGLESQSTVTFTAGTASASPVPMPLSERGPKETNIIMASIKQAMTAPTTNAVELLLIIRGAFY